VSSSEALRKLVQEGVDDFGPDQPGVLTGAVLVAEWVGEDGDPWLSWITTDARGDTLPSWRVRGLTMDVLETLQTREIVKNLRDSDDE
jgi:hypothetical protein